MTELIDWLREQIDEDERVALAAGGCRWEVGPTFGAQDNRVYIREEGVLVDTVGTCVIAGQVANISWYRANAGHIARQDPARVLAEVAAKRRLLELHSPVERGWWSGPAPHPLQCEHCAGLCHSSSGISCDDPDAPYPCPTVRLMALPYADRPGYREEWRP